MLWAVFKFPAKHIFVLAMEYLITRWLLNNNKKCCKRKKKSEPVDLSPKYYPSCHRPLTSPFLFVPSARPLPSAFSLTSSLPCPSSSFLPVILPWCAPHNPLNPLPISYPSLFSQSSRQAPPWPRRPACPPTAAAPPAYSPSLQLTWCLPLSSRRAPLPLSCDPRTPLRPRAPALMLTACKVSRSYLATQVAFIYMVSNEFGVTVLMCSSSCNPALLHLIMITISHFYSHSFLQFSFSSSSSLPVFPFFIPFQPLHSTSSL